MQTTIDRAGRLVVPVAAREQVGLTAGPVEIAVVGATLVISPIASDGLVDSDGLLLLPPGENPLTVDEVRALRDADQR